MRGRRRVLAPMFFVFILTCAATPQSAADTCVAWNRRINRNEIHINLREKTPSQISPAIHVEVIGPAATHQNLNTSVRLSVNGGPPDSALVIATGGTGGTTCSFDCNAAGCGEGGECLKLPPDIQPTGCNPCCCDIVITPNWSKSIQPGDVLRFSLAPAAGALTEPYTVDDTVTVVVPSPRVPALNSRELLIAALLLGLAGTLVLYGSGRATSPARLV